MSNQQYEEGKPAPPRRRVHRGELVILLLGIALAISLGYSWFQHRSIGQMTAARDQLAASLNQTKAEVDAISAQLKAMAVAPKPVETAAPVPIPVVPKQKPKTVHRNSTQLTRVSSPPPDDPRWKKIDSELARTRSELESSIKSSHDELNDSIARTHQEVVALAQRGERNYYEFDLGKSKQFERTGPISLSLRKANTKHLYCDLEVRVDDNQVSKKHVNLFEPVYFSPAGHSQPIELVINRIDKNHIKGYVSKPKYGQTQVASGRANVNDLTLSNKAAAEKKP